MFMLRFRYPAAIAVLLLLGVCLPGWAGTIYSGSNNSQLVAIDTVTGHGTPADQPFGVGGVFAGAFSPNGTFYIVTGMNSNNSQLATVDLLTGHANPYAHLAINSIDMLQFSPSGILYASDGSTLFRMNVTTGALTTIGNFFPGNGGMMDLAMDSHGTLFGVASGIGTTGFSHFFTIDPAKGPATPLATPLFSVDTGCIMGLAFDSGDNLYATNFCLQDSPLYQVDLAAHSLSIVAMTGLPNLHGGDIAPVPEPAVLWTLGSGLLLVMGLSRRNWKRGSRRA